MDIKLLFEDFKKYVNSMSIDDIKKSIMDALDHTSNSYTLEDIIKK